MGNIKSFFFNKTEPIRALFLGLDAAGKTSILYNLKLGKVVTTIPTIGFNVETLKNKDLNIIAWDVGGREKIRILYRHYLQNSKIVIFVLDSNDRDRLTEAKEELHKICSEDELQNCMLIVLANKQDLKDAMSIDEIKKNIEFDSISLHQKKIFGTVAFKIESLEVVLDWIQENLNKENDKIVQPIEETFNDVKKITNAKSWIEYFKKLSHIKW